MKHIMLCIIFILLASCGGQNSDQTTVSNTDQKNIVNSDALDNNELDNHDNGSGNETLITVTDTVTDNIGSLVLDKRSGEGPEVTEGIPHIQMTQVSNDDVYETFINQIYTIDGIVNDASQSSLPGARAFALEDSLDINQAAMITGREFGHIHANPGRGSLHIVLSVDDAQTVVDNGWGVYHPFALNRSIPGMVMVFSPRDDNEIQIIMDIIRVSFRFATRG